MEETGWQWRGRVEQQITDLRGQINEAEKDIAVLKSTLHDVRSNTDKLIGGMAEIKILVEKGKFATMLFRGSVSVLLGLLALWPAMKDLAKAFK